MKYQYVLPADIERVSMETITEELKLKGYVIPTENQAVVRRVIHTTADFDYADNLVFTSDAVKKGIESLAAGATIITDTNMALSGISKPTLATLSCNAVCYMADKEIARAAKAAGSTRATVSMIHGAHEYPDAIFAVGNAPTALIKLSELIRGGLRPSLIIAVPVGFVNVVESKEEILQVCREFDIPAIVAMGRKGGSNVAAAICNALLYSAADTLDPVKRGW